jgi:RES domain-containing protein
MRRVYRVCRSIHARLDGAGAMRVGGRWNSPGKRVVYMAQSISLAVLENLVHMNKVDFPVGYVSVSAIIPDHVRVLTGQELRASSAVSGPRELGDHWVESLTTAVLEVRSVVVPLECNYLLNPGHRDFGEILVEPGVPFVFDERLFK